MPSIFEGNTILALINQLRAVFVGRDELVTGTAVTNLNADMVDGLHAATSGANAHVLATDASGNAVVSSKLSIGTTSSFVKFDIDDGSTTKNNVAMVLSHAGYIAADGASTEIILGALSSEGIRVLSTGARIRSIEDYSSGYGVGLSMQYRTVGDVLMDGVTLTKTGNVGIKTTSPTSPLQVVGLLVYANNAAAVAGGLTAGAFYRNGADPDHLCVVH